MKKAALPIAVLFASLSSIFIRFADAPSLVIAFYRMFFAFLLVAPFHLFRRSGGEKVSRGELSLALLGGLFLALHFATWITSLSYTSVASSVLLVNTHPVLVFVFSRLVLKEGGSRGDSFYVLLTLLGSALLSWGDLTLGRQALLGDFLALLGAVSVAGYMLIGRVVRRNMGVARYTFIVYGSCALFLLLGLGLFSLPLGPYSGKDFALFFALAFFCTILGHGIYNWALRFVGPTFLSVNVLLEPVAAGVMAYFFFQEIPGGLNILGAAVVLLGIFGYSRGENKRRTMKNSS